jgi:hypothetical protein
MEIKQKWQHIPKTKPILLPIVISKQNKTAVYKIASIADQIKCFAL